MSKSKPTTQSYSATIPLSQRCNITVTKDEILQHSSSNYYAATYVTISTANIVNTHDDKLKLNKKPIAITLSKAEYNNLRAILPMVDNTIEYLQWMTPQQRPLPQIPSVDSIPCVQYDSL